MKIIVTGGAGFVGSHVVPKLQSEHEVLIIDSLHSYYDPRWKQRRLEKLLTHPQVDWDKMDVCNQKGLRDVFQSFRPDIVIHLAAIPGVQASLLDPAAYVDVDVKGTVNLLALSHEYQVSRFVFASSSSVYGTQGTRPCEESEGLEPISPYAASKAAAEMYCQTYQRLYGLPVTIVRPFTVYGPEQRPDMALWTFAKQIWEGKPITLYGDDIGRDYTYVEDTARGIVKAALMEKAVNRIYNLGSGRVVLIRDLISLLERGLGKKAIIVKKELPPGDVPMTWADPIRSKTELGFEAHVSIEEGIHRFTEWFLNEGVYR
ncbi:NAD-dependent epimerase/dehydratase family protein [Brevibacillus ginsengisoli]|uniref:NAD-dependent epimerase/dehydratase family protein n=1 Tax=Brevibacillus ginsengisoli TaxID=363854 RepID=UPI003CF962D5